MMTRQMTRPHLLTAATVEFGDVITLDAGTLRIRSSAVTAVERTDHPDYQFGPLTTATVTYADGTVRTCAWNHAGCHGEYLHRAPLT